MSLLLSALSVWRVLRRVQQPVGNAPKPVAKSPLPVAANLPSACGFRHVPGEESREYGHENSCACGCCRGRRGWLFDRLSSGKSRLARCRTTGARRTDRRVHMARCGPAAVFQHELCDDPYPRLLGQVLQDAGGRDRPERWVLGRRQPAHGAVPGSGWTNTCSIDHGRRDRGDALRVADAGPDQGPLAAGAHRRPRRARSTIRPTATSIRPTSRRRWPRGRASMGRRSSAGRRSMASSRDGEMGRRGPHDGRARGNS